MKRNTTKKKEELTWSPVEIMDGVGDGMWFNCEGEGVEGLHDGDRLLVDRTLRKPNQGDYVIWKIDGEFTISQYTNDEHEGELWAIGVAVVRQFPRKNKRRKVTSNDGDQERQADLASLSQKLSRLEFLPENEAVRFKLESEIYRLEREATADEWPDVIEGAM